ncbi:tRNA pseudouridine(55) synthase TruB [Candidatus Paracaedibacter symbiosus]|uniref:tRNA pseudouridine(55) synthase TruB n=1 Tax=Candidatus Paracaedibacter symbiosus TaxID=244582 RepID=UPI0005097B1A|nr:tRNA pseudouridine(55) synthase TruB [Candidatus Paracaedibacter symbiosus]
MMNGWMIIDKPAGFTSTRVGGILKRLCKTKCIGHVGTLDPFATGVLPIAIGEATKTIPYVDTNIKEYEFELIFGAARDTGDLEGEVITTSDVRPTRAAIEQALEQFRGEITQIPPIYSALRINGERAYTLARQGIVPEMKPRQVIIYELELLESNFPDAARLRVLCSTGTYVRTLGQDLAQTLGTVGYLSTLRRTKVGKFTLTDAFSLDNLKEKEHIEQVSSCVLPIRAVLDDIPAVSVSQSEEQKIRQGQAIPDSGLLPESSICLLTGVGGEVSLAETKAGQLFPIRVFNFSK